MEVEVEMEAEILPLLSSAEAELTCIRRQSLLLRSGYRWVLSGRIASSKLRMECKTSVLFWVLDWSWP